VPDTLTARDYPRGRINNGYPLKAGQCMLSTPSPHTVFALPRSGQSGHVGVRRSQRGLETPDRKSAWLASCHPGHDNLASITVSATRCPAISSAARRGGLRGAGGLGRVPRAVEDNLIGVSFAVPNDLLSCKVAIRHDGQHRAREAFRVELRLNLRLQRVARFECTPTGGR
jgi:hypothetical protein